MNFKLLNNTTESKVHTEKMAKEKLNLILCTTKEALYNLKRTISDKNSIEARLSSNHFHLFLEVLHKTFTFKEAFFFSLLQDNFHGFSNSQTNSEFFKTKKLLFILKL